MARVLLVENEGVWLDLIRQALPEYDVDKAQSFNEALALLRGDAAYDVAIVDLNLLPGDRRDKLGGRLLGYIRDRHPTIRRILLTGEPPTAMKALFDQYNLDDLLLKYKIDLSVVHEVVETALQRAAGDAPDEFRFEKLELKDSLRSWKNPVSLRLAQQAQTLRNDIQNAERVEERADGSLTALGELEDKRQELEAECYNFVAMVDTIHTIDGLVRAREELERLKAIYGAPIDLYVLTVCRHRVGIDPVGYCEPASLKK